MRCFFRRARGGRASAPNYATERPRSATLVKRGQVEGDPGGRRMRCGSPGGSSASSPRFGWLLSWRVTVRTASSITSLRRRPLIRLPPMTSRSSGRGWTRTTSEPAARSLRASLPSVRPDADRMAAWRRPRRWRVGIECRQEVGLKQITRSRPRSATTSRLDGEWMPLIHVPSALDRHRVVEGWYRARGGDRVREVGAGSSSTSADDPVAGGVVARDYPMVRVIRPPARKGASDRFLERLGRDHAARQPAARDPSGSPVSRARKRLEREAPRARPDRRSRSRKP
jgi:hypothetical protein